MEYFKKVLNREPLKNRIPSRMTMVFIYKMQDDIKTEDMLERAEIESLSAKVKTKRWKMIGYILRQDRGSDGNNA